jgi:hypothetical protein
VSKLAAAASYDSNCGFCRQMLGPALHVKIHFQRAGGGYEMRKNRREKGVLKEILSSFSLNKQLIFIRALSCLFIFVDNFMGSLNILHCTVVTTKLDFTI